MNYFCGVYVWDLLKKHYPRFVLVENLYGAPLVTIKIPGGKPTPEAWSDLIRTKAVGSEIRFEKLPWWQNRIRKQKFVHVRHKR